MIDDLLFNGLLNVLDVGSDIAVDVAVYNATLRRVAEKARKKVQKWTWGLTADEVYDWFKKEKKKCSRLFAMTMISLGITVALITYIIIHLSFIEDYQSLALAITGALTPVAAGAIWLFSFLRFDAYHVAVELRCVTLSLKRQEFGDDLEGWRQYMSENRKALSIKDMYSGSFFSDIRFSVDEFKSSLDLAYGESALKARKKGRLILGLTSLAGIIFVAIKLAVFPPLNLTGFIMLAISFVCLIAFFVMGKSVKKLKNELTDAKLRIESEKRELGY